MENEDFAVFILTHGRPNKVITYTSLLKAGYTGKIYIVIDDEDETREEYEKRFKNVIVFSKEEISKKFDGADNFKDRRSIVYARNACFEIAESLGITYFLELDDDYLGFNYKFNTRYEYHERPIKSLDRVFEMLLNYYKVMDCLCLAMSQNGDFIGGADSGFSSELKMKRKAMNVLFCSTKRKFKFMGRINEDVNTYVTLGGRGKLFLTVPNVAINQMTTQKNKGGMSELYLDAGTYVKSFYSIIFAPSCVKINEIGTKHKRIHHRINWNTAVPKILNEKYCSNN